MPTVRIWALESDYDKEVVQILSEKIAILYKSEVVITSAGRATFASIARQPNGLAKAVANYLKQDSRVIFVLDIDGPSSYQMRLSQPNSLISQVKAVTSDPHFAGKVFLVLAKFEIEAWLLTDCLGVAGYFLKDYYRLQPETCHLRLQEKDSITRLITRRQSGDTTKFVEAVPGSRNAKEELADLSTTILETANPKLRPSDLKAKRYRESMSPGVARFISVTKESIRRNHSLVELGDLIKSTTG